VTEYYGWECVSLKQELRTVDFVIKDEQIIIQFLLAMQIMQLLNHLGLTFEKDIPVTTEQVRACL
jgi:hypothetical protein